MEALNFNSLQQPSWEVTLKDTDQTTLHLTAPTVELLDRLTAMAPELREVAKKKDGRALHSAFELVAQLMSCNEEGFEFTAEELRDRYSMTFIDLLIFVKGYMEFITEIKNAKN